MTFPTAHSVVIYNDEGEMLGWGVPSEPDPNDHLDDDDDWFDDEPEEEVEDHPTYPRGTHLTVEGRGGVAWTVRRATSENVICVMVGDNREFEFEHDEVTVIDRDAFCGSCGQIGCTHDGLDR